MTEYSDLQPLMILRQAYGRFDRRSRIGPARWPHHDLLWIHSGTVALALGPDAVRAEITAPGGLWIAPATAFQGPAPRGPVLASITHFGGSRPGPEAFALADPTLAPRLQAMVELSQSYAVQGTDMRVRLRLLEAILDGFAQTPATPPPGRIETAWAMARGRLGTIRGLEDVASLAGLSESAFRAEHRRTLGGSAGQHLIGLRLEAARHLLATTGLPAARIATEIGYHHPESFFRAFRRRYGTTPAKWRAAQGPFA